MSTQNAHTELSGKPARPNPKRQAAGRRNQLLCRGLTASGRERLRASARAHQPWRSSTGPTSEAGKLVSARNGAYRQDGPVSVRAAKRIAKAVSAEIQALRSAQVRIVAAS